MTPFELKVLKGTNENEIKSNFAGAWHHHKAAAPSWIAEPLCAAV